eukprot:g10623.t1
MKAARGFTLALRLLLAATSTANSTFADTDGIPEVGIGAVHPVCGAQQEECISSDERVQDEILAGLQAEAPITGTSNAIELGELLCDGIEDASSSAVLRFAISSKETVTAERTSYSEFDGTVFSDGKQRKVWKGTVVDLSLEAVAASPRTISMTWTSPCDTNTFLLKMTTHNPDGTLSFATSVPCAAGSSTEICMVQEQAPAGKEPTGEEVWDSAATTSRQLQSTVEVDVMFLYDEAVLDRFSRDYLETVIADELPSSNEAAANSLVDLRFNLVHTGELPYVVGSTDDILELSNLRGNSEVEALRNLYQADLVVLVGYFPTTCGRAYVNFSAQPYHETYGYGLIDRNCFDGRTTTHELGHNLGADHDRINTGLGWTDYGHGKRYCGEDGVRYRTIMAYPCWDNTQSDESSSWSEWANYFSNPDVDYKGLPTGTSTQDNARVLRENMMVVSNFRERNDGGSGCGSRDGGSYGGSDACCSGGVRALDRVCSASVGAPCVVSDDPPTPTPAPATTEDGTCAADIPGILDGDVCCPNSCGGCGGSGCSARDGGNNFTGGEACCKGGVKDLGRICSSTVGAPCIVSDDPPAPTPSPVTEEDQMCAADIPGILDGDVCCPNSCGGCGGSGCSARDGGNNFTGGEACCKGGVKDLGRICSSTVGAPCIVSDDPPAPTPSPVTEEDQMCAADIPGILDGDVCCPNSCGGCGGSGCSARDGGNNFTGGEACCKGGVKDLGRICSSTVGAPCIVSDDPPSPTPAPIVEANEVCTAGVPGILVNDVCCPNSCGACGGSGCSGRDGGGSFTGSEACCGGGVKALGRVCSATVGAPCIIAETEEEMCTAGIPGILASDACCPNSCGACGGSGCGARDGGGDFTGSQACCVGGVRGLSRVCSASVGAPCVIAEDEDKSDDSGDDELPPDDFTCDGVQKGEYCCSDGCGDCGGSGCSNRGGGLTGDDCCTKNILASGRKCSATRAAPCFFD